MDTKIHGPNIPELKPKKNANPAVWDIVLYEMRMRKVFGIEKYGTPLQPFNERDALWDAYQEALDLVVYLRQEIYERDNTPKPFYIRAINSIKKFLHLERK